MANGTPSNFIPPAAIELQTIVWIGIDEKKVNSVFFVLTHTGNYGQSNPFLSCDVHSFFFTLSSHLSTGPSRGARKQGMQRHVPPLLTLAPYVISLSFRDMLNIFDRIFICLGFSCLILVLQFPFLMRTLLYF